MFSISSCAKWVLRRIWNEKRPSTPKSSQSGEPADGKASQADFDQDAFDQLEISGGKGIYRHLSGMHYLGAHEGRLSFTSRIGESSLYGAEKRCREHVKKLVLPISAPRIFNALNS